MNNNLMNFKHMHEDQIWLSYPAWLGLAALLIIPPF